MAGYNKGLSTLEDLQHVPYAMGLGMLKKDCKRGKKVWLPVKKKNANFQENVDGFSNSVTEDTVVNNI